MAHDDDQSFGPQYGDRFDFTLRFEHIIFTILPATVLIAAYPILLYQYTRKSIVVGRGWSLYAKLASAVCLFGLGLAELVLWTQQPSAYYSSLAIIASALSCVAVGCIINFLYVEHSHALQASSLLSIYLTIGILLDATKARSCFARAGSLDAIGSVLVAAAALKGSILVLEEVPKGRQHLQEQRFSSEATSGFWTRAFFVWVNKTLFAGYRSIIDMEDLEPLGPEFSGSTLSDAFAAVWAKTKKTPTSHCLMRAMLWSLIQPVCAVVIPRFCYTGFLFSQPFLIQRIINYVDKQDGSLNTARGLIGAAALIYLGIAISKAAYMHMNYRLVTLARGVLISQILAKSLKISYSEAGKKAALSNMSTDIESLVTGLPMMHDIWISFFEVGIGAYILTTVVGRASFLIALPLLISAFMSLVVGKYLIPTRKDWNDKIEYRVSQTASLLTYIKGIKMLALEAPSTAYIQSLRVAELNKSKKFRLLSITLNIAAGFADYVTPVIVLTGALFWVTTSKRLTASDAFTSLTIIALTTWPMIIILRSASWFSPALGCMRRIQDFLLLEETQDGRTELQPTGFTNDKAGFMTERTSSLGRGEVVINGHRVSIQSQSGSSIINEASFSIRRSTITVVTGPVASGKSVLLRALLGEVPFNGAIQINPLNRSIAYCDQLPWIRNISLCQNILGEQQQPLDRAWYEAVLEACLLVDDVSQLPEGDETLAGSNGIHFSGGQNQRIALARAVYSRAPIMIFDDVFSSLDAPTSAAISSRLFGSRGLLRDLGTTVIIASHSLLHASLADTILFFDGAGNIQTRAAPKNLPSRDATTLAALRDNSIDALGPGVKEITNPQEDALVKEKVAELTAEEAQEDRTLRRKGDRALYAFYFRSTKAWVACCWLSLITITSISGALPAIFIRIWLEVDPNNNRYFIGFALLGCFPCVAVGLMFLFFYLRAIPESANNLHEMLLKSVMGATISFLSETDTGVLLNRFSQDMSLICQELPRALMVLILVAGHAIISAGLVASGAKYMASILPLLALVVYVIQHFYLRTSRQMRYLDLEAKTPLYTHVSETATGLYNIRALGVSAEVLQDGIRLLDLSQKPFYYMFCIQRWLTLSMDLLAVVIAVTLVSFSVLLPDTTSQTAIGLSLLNLIAIGSNFSEVTEYWTMFETSLGALTRIRSFLKYTPQESDTDGTVIPAENWPQSGHIALSNVTAVYSSTDVPTPVVRNVSLDIYAGQKVLVMGRTGSGKSSLILTLLNFLEYKGFMYIDGVDIAKTPRHILRTRITTITQNTVQLDGILRYNLLPFKLGKAESENGQTTYDADLMDVLSRVRLWEHVVSHGGLDAKMTDLAFSTGQLQLMSIARAVLHNRLNKTNIVLMDEPTSSLDLETDRYIQAEVFSKLFSHCTVIMVAHRLETVRRADLSSVVEMADGMILRVSRL